MTTGYDLGDGVRAPERSPVGGQSPTGRTSPRSLSLLSFDDRAANDAAEVRLELESQGVPIGRAGYLMAGICLSRSASLLTRNRDDFSRIGDLELSDL